MVLWGAADSLVCEREITSTESVAYDAMSHALNSVWDRYDKNPYPLSSIWDS